MTLSQGIVQPVARTKSAKGSLVQDEPRDEGTGMRKHNFLGQVKKFYLFPHNKWKLLVKKGLLDLAIQLAALKILCIS